MKHILTVLMAGTLALGVMGAAGCTPDPAAATCDDFDQYLATCWAGCGASWDCEYYYDSLDYQTQLDLDECSICLYDEAYYGSCGDCPAPGGGSCQEMVEFYLGVACW